MAPSAETAAAPPRRPGLRGYVAAVALVAAATFAAVAVDRLVGVPNLSLIFVLPVVIAAVSFGWGPSLLAAVGGAFAFNFFLIEPRYSLRVEDPANAWALALLLIVGAIVSWIAGLARRRAVEAGRHADQLRGTRHASLVAPMAPAAGFLRRIDRPAMRCAGTQRFFPEPTAWATASVWLVRRIDGELGSAARAHRQRNTR